MKRGLLISLAAVVGVVLTVILAVSLVLGTQAGSRWALARVPGLTLESFSGRLGGHWQADKLVWQQQATRVEVQALELAWSPACLWRMTLCIDTLHAGAILAQLPASQEPASSGPIVLPDLQLPVAIELGDVRIGSLELDGVQQLSGLELAAHWTADGLKIDRAHLQREEMVLDANGTLRPGGQWPLDLNVQVQLPAVDDKPWQVTLNATGDLLDTLTLDGESSGYLQALISGTVQPLAEHLPAQLRIQSEAFKPSAGLPDTLAFNQLELLAKGDLQGGYAIDGRASLPAEQSPMTLLLGAQVDAKGAVVQALDISSSAQQHVRLSGTLDWQQGLAAKARIDWLDFPWHRLYPVIAEPAVKVRRFNGEIDYSDGKYLGNLKGAFDGPAGAFTLVTPFSGDLQQVFLPQLELVAGQGKAAGHLNLKFADGIAWDTALALSAIDPAYWVAQMPGSLAGPLRSTGEFKNEQLTLDAELDLKGRLRGQPAVFQANAQGAGERWTLGNLDVRLGDNRIKGQGSLQQQVQGRLDIDLARLGQLWPGLQGQLKGQLDAAGTLQAPQGKLKLLGQQLAMDSNRLQNLNVNAGLDGAQNGTLDVSAAGIRVGETDLGTLSAKASGDIKRQQVQLALKGPQLALATSLDGTLDKGFTAQSSWRGRLASGSVQAGGQDWRLQAPARLEYLAGGRVNFGAHCWRSGAASLCGEDQRLAPEPRLRYHLKQFPLDSLAQWLPKDFAWQGMLNADVAVDVPASGPAGEITVDAGNGTLRVRNDQQWVDFPYQTLRLTSRLNPKRIDTELNFRGDRLGQLQVIAQIDPIPDSKPVTGSFRLAGLDLSIARPFVPMVETLKGQLDGSGQITGSLMAPQVNGNVRLSGGEIAGPELPTTLEDLQLQAQIAGESVRLQGSWKSGKTGQGTLGGTVAWADALDVDVQLKGSRLPINVEPYATLEAAPDLRIQMNGERLAVVGKVFIPKGAIVVRQLPPSTVKLSDDVVIVGNQTEQGKTPLPMAIDIDVEVGQEKLTFNGFGLSANLAGHVHIGDNLDTRGELALNDGRYNAYGQRLTIRRARLLFAGPISQPYLDIEAIRTTGDVIAGIRLTGNAEQPTSEVFSEPTMSQEQALSYLVLGRPLGNSGEDNNMLAQAALGLGLMGSSGVTSKLATDLGIEDFQLDTQGSGDATSVVASGNISEKLSLRYGVGVFEPANTIALRYLLSKRLYLEVASGVASSLDLFYKRDF
ncbi:translocation/assembly module TamB [Pseudomonas sp. CFBP 8770]|uniref:translocation/assembly module TamB domain-containing protein n=1 Tax=unclassified Pseudomonas TaxID=196821 RepID=UPI00177C4E2B|nr:translocation/assembly module TamB [Pseudomonas sp. CFBP 8773]MBD8646213.1 translocation/assembly module TamB [Pseudomonas sp. CFBP 8770]